ncbi:MAG: cob(I)yrinic acid a,c-diamide adenosyltransferase [Clostridium sp.]|uniref:cob(I)yrinic acid a,c-diamide adenosyltransferase n=1 Tax=Clostridium sp. TaxID=1506 RepID=UPI002FC93418
MWKVYTKTGDKGYTSTASHERIPKNSYLINLQGGVDEINSHVGYLRSLICEDPYLLNVDNELREIQKNLFYLGSEISYKFSKPSIKSQMINDLEEAIDFYQSKCPPLNSFVYCSGHKTSTYSQIIRSIIRRAERDFLSALEEQSVNELPDSYVYVNRLSDYFFSLSRYLNHYHNVEEEPMVF